MTPGGRPGGVHLPVAVDERPHGRGFLREAVLDALLRVEEGPEDRHVLPPHPPQGRRHPVHGRPVLPQGLARREGGAGG